MKRRIPASILIPVLLTLVLTSCAGAAEVKLNAGDGAVDDQFGTSVSISGDYAIVGACYDDDRGSSSGSAYIFKRDGTSWDERTKITASDGATGDWFGYSVSMSGDYAIVGAYRDDDSGSYSGSAYIFKRDGTSWSEQAKIIASDGAAVDLFGYSVSMSGDYAIVGAYGDDDRGSASGSAYIFKRDEASWDEQVKITASDGAAYDYFGRSASISGDYAIVGACYDGDSGSYSGSAYIFKRDRTSWSEQAKITAIDGAEGDRFGHHVSISGDSAIVGAYGDDDCGSNSGSAYIFKRDGASWDEQAKMTASDGAVDDYFSQSSVSISGDYAIVGAYGDDDCGSNSGSAYVYDILTRPPPDPTNLANTVGNYWVNYTWQAGTGNVTDSYNVNMNGIWTNGTTATFLNTSVDADGWANITLWAWNTSGTGTLSAGCVSDEVQAPSEPSPQTFNCTCGDICVNTSGWWRDGGVLNTSGTPIQAAVNAAAAGETICVRAGSYTENVGVNKRVTLAGEGVDVVTVTAASTSDHVFKVTADYVNISGFNVTGTTSSNAGIYLGSGVDHCIISDNIASGNYYGICLWSSSNYNTLLNNTANSNSIGIRLYSSSNNMLTNNTGSYNHYGIHLYSSSNNTLLNNNASDNYKGIHLWSSSKYNTLANNTANSNNVGIYLSSSGNYNTLASNTANSNTDFGIHLQSSSYNALANNTANSNTHGIYLSSSSYNTLTDNTANSNTHGIYLPSSGNNTLLNNTANSNRHGIDLWSSSNNTLLNNTANSNNYGIYLSSSGNYNTLTNNTANSNNIGIYLSSSSNNMLTSNTANSNTHGIFILSSSDSQIYNNYFNNTNNAYDDGYNAWNITPTAGINIIGGSWIGGNYWSDYVGADTTGDGLGDTLTPHDSSDNIQNGGDYHPLVQAAAIYTPPDPTTLANTAGNFWVNHTWSAGSGNVTDSYNVRVNGVWHNTTTDTFRNDTYTAHAWQNITAYAWNRSTGTPSAGSVSQNTQIPNNPTTVTNTSDWSVDGGENVYVDYNAVDADSDTPTFSCNHTDLFTDFSTATGQGNWTTTYTDSGVYYVDFGVSDGWGSTSNYTMTIVVGGTAPPVIHSVVLDPIVSEPNGSISVTVTTTGDSGIASVTADGISLADAGDDTWTGTITAASTPGVYNATVVATDNSTNPSNVTDDSAAYTVKKLVPPATLFIEDFTARQWERVTVPIAVFDAVNLSVCEINLTYDPTVVRMTDVIRGDLRYSFKFNVNNGSGWMRANALDVEGLSGNVTFAYLTLTAVGNKGDVSEMEFEDSRLLDTSFKEIAHITRNGTFSIANVFATPDTILYDNDRPRTPGTNVTLLSAQVIDTDGNITAVTIDLSSIGGLPAQPMEHVSGDIWEVTTNATEVAMDAPNFTHQLTINATDDEGSITNSVSIELTVLKRGDVNGDGLVNKVDADYLSNYVAGLEPEASNPPGVLIGDVIGEAGCPMGDGVVDMMDALYIAKYTSGMVEEP
jgi:parallel beta-helix repeat protein